jgi:hypothetical protein
VGRVPAGLIFSAGYGNSGPGGPLMTPLAEQRAWPNSRDQG